MFSATRLRVATKLPTHPLLAQRFLAISARQLDAKAVSTPASETVLEPALPSTEVAQAPNRSDVWARSQQPRTKAMTGPRFEQTDFSKQPQPYSAIELVHKQPVTWTHDRIVVCDGGAGGGPGGHPRIFINTDKAEICACGYCGLPFANEHHRKHLEALPETSYPLS